MIALEEENARRRQECQENEGKGKELDKDDGADKAWGFYTIEDKRGKLVKYLEVEGYWDGLSLGLAFSFSIASIQPKSLVRKFP